MDGVVVACPCGEDHALTAAAFAAFERLMEGHELDAAVAAGGWRVPVVWIACHGLKGADVAMLASLHGWPRA